MRQSWREATRAGLWAYFATPLPSPAEARGRALRHLGVAALVTALAFVVNLLLVVTTLPALVFCVVCALKAGLTYGASLYLVDEWLAPRLPRGWGAFPARTVGRIWAIGGAGFLLGFALLGVQDHYLGAEIAAWLRVGPHRAPTPPLAPWESLLRTVPFAVLTVFLVVHIRLKRQLQREFEHVARLNEILRSRHEPGHGDAPGSPSSAGGPPPTAAYPKVVLATATTAEAVAPERISHVTIEEHYARIFVQEGESVREIEVKLPLKKLQALLPPALFAQVHRSHLVNLEHVGRVERTATGYQLALARSPITLPISRSRVRDVLPRLHAFWNAP